MFTTLGLHLMTFEEGWEREYTRAIKTVAKKPVFLVGRVSHPAVADELVGSGDADAILLARQMIADEQWMTKVKEGRVERHSPLRLPLITAGGR